MKLIDFIPEEAFVADVQASSKREAIAELLDALVSHNHVPGEHADAVLEALMSREELGSTGIGKGVAVPHATNEAVPQLVGAIGRSKEGVDFQALDAQPVDLFFMILAPPDCTDRLDALKLVAQLVAEPDMCRFLRNAKDTATVRELLHEAQARL